MKYGSKEHIEKVFNDLTVIGLQERNKPRERFLIFSRVVWEGEVWRSLGYDFTKEELDEAEKLDVKLIGERNGVKCYLPSVYK